MSRFRYLRDPLFMSGCVCYAVNRWLLKPHCSNVFLRGYFNDLFLIPCALPPILLLHRWLRLRVAEEKPRVSEILFHFAVWSVLFEFLGPKWIRTTGDPLDILAYGAGTIVAIAWWRGEEIFQLFHS